MHWLVSQAIFLTRIQIYNADGTYSEAQDSSYFSAGATPAANDGTTTRGVITLPGYSPKAIIAVIVVGVVMLLFVVGMGFKSYETAIPLVGNNSLAIGAACHASEGDEEAAGKEVMWGWSSMRGRWTGSFSPLRDIVALRVERWRRQGRGIGMCKVSWISFIR